MRVKWAVKITISTCLSVRHILSFSLLRISLALKVNSNESSAMIQTLVNWCQANDITIRPLLYSFIRTWIEFLSWELFQLVNYTFFLSSNNIDALTSLKKKFFLWIFNKTAITLKFITHHCFFKVFFRTNF